jgi:hypothetical protein
MSLAHGLVAVVLTVAPYAHATAIDPPSSAPGASDRTTASDVVLAVNRPKPHGPRPQGSLPHRPHGAAAPAVPGHHNPAQGGHHVDHPDPTFHRPTTGFARPVPNKFMQKVHGAKEKVKSFGRKIKNKFKK